MTTDFAARRHPGRPAQSAVEALDAEENVERYRLHCAQEMRRFAEEVEQRAWTRLAEIIDERARLRYGQNLTSPDTSGRNGEG